jgi:hypothetical protein
MDELRVVHWPTNAAVRSTHYLHHPDSRQLCAGLRVSRRILRENVMGVIDIDIGGTIEPKTGGSRICRAMAQQRQPDGRNENGPTPQEFVHLVGCRDPNARRTTWVPPRPIPIKP